MLDDRLSKEENDALIGEDIYDIHEIFEDIESCIEFIHNKTNIPLEEIRLEFNISKGWSFDEEIDDYYSVYDKYIVFKTGRVAIVEFY